MIKNHWNLYKLEANKTFKQFGDDTIEVLLMGLTSEIGEYYDLLSKSITKNEDFTEEKKIELGDIFWYLSSLETYFEIENLRSTRNIITEVKASDKDILNNFNLHSILFSHFADFSAAVNNMDDDEIEFNLNKLFFCILNICSNEKFNVLEILEKSIYKLKVRHEESYDANAVKNKSKESYTVKTKTKTKNNLVEISLKLDNRKNSPYKGLILKSNCFGDKLFLKEDIITDMFNCMDFIYSKLNKEKEYSINYSDELIDFIQAENLKAAFVIDFNNGEDPVIETRTEKLTGKQISRPVVINDKIKSFNDLLEHTFKYNNI